ncbi:uncharacterized protein G2W53_028981 [Senna tora]|uniref:Uncharacterized protein n=2 Tax=Senna tora TaxID=362788 RepID=A0A834T6W2_9FABA|nr:uncharacterized protein G2W53_028981 [Senna tora]
MRKEDKRKHLLHEEQRRVDGAAKPKRDHPSTPGFRYEDSQSSRGRPSAHDSRLEASRAISCKTMAAPWPPSSEPTS